MAVTTDSLPFAMFRALSLEVLSFNFCKLAHNQKNSLKIVHIRYKLNFLGADHNFDNLVHLVIEPVSLMNGGSSPIFYVSVLACLQTAITLYIY